MRTCNFVDIKPSNRGVLENNLKLELQPSTSDYPPNPVPPFGKYLFNYGRDPISTRSRVRHSRISSTNNFPQIIEGEERGGRRERYTRVDSPHLLGTSGVVFVYDHGTQNMLGVLTLGSF